MDDFRKTIKRRIFLLLLLIIFSVALVLFDVFWVSPDIKESPVYGFQVGIILSLGLLAILTVRRYRSLLKDENKLLLKFNKENDERIKAIKAKAGIPILPLLAAITIIAGVIAGYFDNLIFMTLIIAATSQMLVCVLVKLIYMKKM